MSIFRVNTILLFLLLCVLVSSSTYAALSVQPLNPKGNLSMVNLSWTRHHSKAGTKRPYMEYITYTSKIEAADDVAFETTGKDLNIGYDYELNSGSIGIAYDQLEYQKDSTDLGTDDDVYGQTLGWESVQKSISLYFVHDIGKSSSFGLRYAHHQESTTKTETVSDPCKFRSTGTNKMTGSVDLSYGDIYLFAKFGLTDSLAIGALFSPAVTARESYNGDYDDYPKYDGHGTLVDVAVGVDLSEVVAEVRLATEAEHPETLDGNGTELGVSTEFLVADKFSIEAGYATKHVAKVEYEGNENPSYDTRQMLFGINCGFHIVTISPSFLYLE